MAAFCNIYRLILIALMSLIPYIMKAQESIEKRDTTLEVSLLTCRAGSNIYELEGHTALRFVDNATGEDVTVNWGLFDFDAPNFVYRFVKGETDYCIGAAPTQYFLNAYSRQGRAVVEQKLNLSQPQALYLRELAKENLLPENRVYRYNYVLDNCSTRPLRLIEKAIGDTISLSGSSLAGVSTFRNAMRSYHRAYPWYQFGIDLALGSGLDRPISIREAAFAPESLEKMMTTATLPSGDNVIVNSSIILTGRTEGGPLDPTPWWLTPMFWSIIVGLVSLILSVRQVRSGKYIPNTLTKLFDCVLFSLFGVLGLVLTFLIFVSVHEATSPNWLYLWLNPLAFIAAVSVWVKAAKSLLYSYQIVNFALQIALVAIFLCGIQSPNPAFYPLIAADAMRAFAYIFTYRTNIHQDNA